MSDQSQIISPEAMPESLRELVRVLGEIDALRLVSSHGGARITVPKTPKAEHPLRLALSEAAFLSLVAEYGGEALDLPKGDAYLRELRHEQVRECRRQKKTADETAEATGYSRRHVLNIWGGHAGGVDRFTIDMFDESEETGAAPWPVAQAGTAHDPFGLGSKPPR
jgi:hypothetical protein